MLKIFISYSQDDYSPGARHVRNYISRHIQDSDVFIDQSKPKGSKWRKENEEKLEASDIFIVILTHGALRSKEVRKEVAIAKQKKDRKIIPCKEDLLDMEWKDIPWNLSEYDGVKFEDKEELGRRLVTEIKKIRKLEMPRQEIVSLSQKNSISLTTSGLTQNLDYQITNGEVLSAIVDREALAIILSLVSYGDGMLTITLPRGLIDAKVTAEEDDNFFVLVDGTESNYTEETTTNFERILAIPFLKGDSEIEVIGTEILGISFVGATKEENVVKLVKGSSSVKRDEKYLKPQTLTVKSGDKVKWINVDDAAHTVTSGDITSKGPDGLFDSSMIAPNKTFEVTFNKKGVYRYFCAVHPWTEGKIIVE